MTAILHPSVPISFTSTKTTAKCRLNESLGRTGRVIDREIASTATSIHERSRQPSPSSVFSVVSAPTTWNNENLSPFSQFEDRAHSRCFTSQDISKKGGHEHTSVAVPSSAPLRVPRSPLVIVNEDEYTGNHKNDYSDDVLVEHDAAEIIKPRQAPDLLGNLSSGISTPNDRLRCPSNSHAADVKERVNEPHREQECSEHSYTSDTGTTPQQQTTKQSERSGQPSSLSQKLTSLTRTSDGSSGFIHSMKTASVTNRSASFFQRSSRLDRSTDSYIFHGSQPRYSTDNNRPTSSGSLDTSALRRGIKRQQIIDELIVTEEGYISDLKALVYLYSTLLASASSIPNRIGAAIGCNVTSILHLHEQLLSRLHDARLRTAAMRWADTENPSRLGHNRRRYPRRSERDPQLRKLRVHSRLRSSIDSVEAFFSVSRHSTSAELTDVSEIADIFKMAASDFTLYEEYCANFEIIGLELQKHDSQSWPAYESGIESLARVIMALEHRKVNDRKGLTVSDLLIKPIQRLTKYPLLLEQLLNQTPVVDAPNIHDQLDTVLQAIREVVRMVNLARENPYTRHSIQRKLLLQKRLDFSRLNINGDQFRSMGTVELCGVLHITYQTNADVGGCYAVCILFEEYFLIALPLGVSGSLEVMALIQLSDIRIQLPTDGKGLQCSSTLFTWKISFACEGHYHELLFSGCSKTEEEVWIIGLQGKLRDFTHRSVNPENGIPTCTAFSLRSAGMVFSSQNSLSRESSMQRAATVGSRSSISQVIIRNTHNHPDVYDHRTATSSIYPINRSQSHMNTKRIPLLEPKKSDRTRLENNISDIWTKERLPFPGMIGSRGGHIFRASAGSLVRKLSLASIHTTFSRGRASSLSIASKRSQDMHNDQKATFEVRQQNRGKDQKMHSKPKDIPEVDDMRSVVERMIGAGSMVISKDTESKESVKEAERNRCNSPSFPGPDDSADIFYKQSKGVSTNNQRGQEISGLGTSMPTIGTAAVGRRKKRWSKHWPIGKLKEFSSDAMGIFHSSSSSGL